MRDVLDSREFYEVCQQYRHSATGAEEFQHLKTWIRLHARVDEKLDGAYYEEDKELVG